MNSPIDTSLDVPEPYWKGIILTLSLAVILFTVWCLTHGITTIFMHLYYFPIVLLAYRYRWKGFALATLLAFAYLGLVMVFETGQTDVIIGAFYRLLVFVGIAAVIAYLSDRLGKSQDALRQSSEIKERYISLAPAIILVLDRNGIITFLNKKGGEILDCTPDEVIGTSWSDRFLPERERKHINSVLSELVAGIITQNRVIENPVLTGTGSEKIIRWHNTVLYDEAGSISGTLGYGEDITAEKWAQNALREMQQFQESVIANANVWISVLDTDGTLLIWNDAAEAISGYEKTGVLGKRSIWKQLYPDGNYRKKITGEIQRIIGRDEYLENFETEIRCADGTMKNIVWNTRGLRDNGGSITGYIAIGRDVTAQKTAEFRAGESSRFLGTMIDTLPMPIFFKDAAGRYLGCNPPFEEYIGIKREDLVGKTVYDLSPKDLADKYAAADRQVLENPVPQRYETQVQYADGSRHDVIFYKAPFFNKDGSVGGLIGAFLDITDRKRGEEMLRQNQLQLANAMDIAHLVNWEYDVASGMFTFDNRFYSLFATTAEREGGNLMSAGTYAREFVHPDDRALVGVAIQTLLETGDPEFRGQMEHRIIRRNGEIRTIIARYAPVMDEHGKVIRTFGANQDITEQKQMEDALTESRQLFADIISFLPDPTFVIDKEGKVLAWNHALEQLSGVPAAEMIGKGDYEYSIWLYEKRRPLLIDLVLDPDKDAARLNYTDIHGEGRTVTAQTEISRNGQKIPLSLVASPLIDAQGKVTGAIESMRDISHVKEAEAALARLNASLETIVRDRTRALEEEVIQRKYAEDEVQAALDYTRSVIEANPDLMVVLDTGGVILDVNAAGELLTGIPKEQLIGTPYFGYLVEDGTVKSAFAGLLTEGKIENFIRIRHTRGHITPLSVHATVIRGIGGKQDQIIVAAHDISRQKKDEEAIQASLDEKVLLLREIHHRVKNNLQIIISLTNLQMRQTDDPAVKQIMSETQNRVRAMSLVHEKLYRSESLSRIDFADYTRFLATQLFSYYGMDTRRVRLDYSMGKIMVDINTAVPLGLLMNELISNALKHAFPGGREGQISISGSDEKNLITLVVRDNGIGIPQDFDWQNTASLGMRLVTSLIDQVDGTIILDRKEGTRFTITVKRDPASGGKADE